jgi:hypothetical protein
VFNEILLKPYYAPSTTLQIEREAKKAKERDSDGNDEEYEVDIVLDSRVSGRGRGRLEYLVKWKNYPTEEATWEPAGNLTNSQELVNEFHKEKPSAPRWVCAQTMKFKKYENMTTPDVPKTLFGWEDGKFEKEYKERLERQWERNWRKWKNEPLRDVKGMNDEFTRT